jgi:hypothetical protein
MSNRTTIGPVEVDGVEYWLHQGNQQTTISKDDGCRLTFSEQDSMRARGFLRKAVAQNLITDEQASAIRHELALS